MAERLTEKCNGNGYISYTSYGIEQQAKQKLYELENLMEKYGVESIEELERKLEEGEQNKITYDWVYDTSTEAINEIKQDRDIWKKACKLACKTMKLPFDILIGNKEFNECHSIAEYFYQQAQKEMKDENDN